MKRVLSILLMILVTAQAAFAAEQVFFYHTDHAGTPLAMTDSTGKVAWKADYRPFGEEQSVTQTQVNDKRFVGKEKDTETGLSYFGARYMDAKTGRFIAPDPVRAVDPKTSKTNEKMLLNPQRLNTYAYALNNPYRYIDPDGKAPLLTAEEMGTNKVLIGGGGIRSASEGTMARPPGGTGGSAGRIPQSTIDVKTGAKVGRFIADERGNIMIEPVGGRTVPAGRNSIDTHTTYPNGSNYQRLNPKGHNSNNTPHGHGHLEGAGPGKTGQGLSIDIHGNVVPNMSPNAHWNIK